MNKYTVNIVIPAGSDFSQVYYLTNPDMSPKDLSGCHVTANIAKHPRALDAVTSTSEEPDYTYSPFKCYIEDGKMGVISLNMNSSQTVKLEEGKYVYGVSIRDVNGYLHSPISGVALVQIDMGSVPVKSTGKATVSSVPPTEKEIGSLWYDTSNGKMYIWTEENIWRDLTQYQ
jgi:hypothetical protein